MNDFFDYGMDAYGPIEGCNNAALNERPIAGDCCHQEPPPMTRPGMHCGSMAHPSPVPPPIPPVRYVPGMNVQEQLCGMAERVNTAINRWNQIQHNCYQALDQVVGAAVNNDVYYAPDEVRLMEGYSETSSSKYTIVEARAVDRSGKPIFCHLRPAYTNTTNSGAKEKITDVSFVTSAQVCLTAVQATEAFWKGPSVFNSNPGAGSPDDTVWVCGWTRSGALRFFSGDVNSETLRQARMVNTIGPVFPILCDGNLFNQVLDSMGSAPGAVQAMGWKQQNGNKVFFSCGMYDNPGMAPTEVAKILQGIGCTNVVITSYQTSAVTTYDAMPVGTENMSGTSVEVPGMTGGMTFLGKLVDAPLQWSIPQNVACWVISKRPTKGWRNAFTTEVANVVQRLGNNENSLNSVLGQISGANQDILQLKNQVQTNANNIASLRETVLSFDERLETIEHDTTTLQNTVKEIQTKVGELESGLQQEITDRINGDNTLDTKLTQEATERKSKDAALEAMISAEQSARESADTVLQSNINTETAERKAADADLQADITAEANTRAQADRNLQAAIEAEQSARSTKDTQHEARMDAIEAQEQKDNEATNKRIDELTANIQDGSALPIATPDTLGVIKVGEGLVVEEDGTLKAAVQDVPEYVGGFGITIEKFEVSLNQEQLAESEPITEIHKTLQQLHDWNSNQDVNIHQLNVAVSTLQSELDKKASAYHAEQGITITDDNGISVTNPVVPITGEEYDKLSDQEKDSNVIWLITDRNQFDPINQIVAGNGITINGNEISVTTPVIPVTQAEYDGLEQDDKDTGLYVIYDDETVARIRKIQAQRARTFTGQNFKG